MSTRSNIKVKDNMGSILLYKHHDGYEKGMLPFLAPFIKNGMESASHISNSLINNSEVEVTSAIHGDIEYYYVINAQDKNVEVHKVDFDGNMEYLRSYTLDEMLEVEKSEVEAN